MTDKACARTGEAFVDFAEPIVNHDALECLRASFDRIQPHLLHVSERFYQDLFETAPEIRRLFAPDMTRMHGHFTAALALLFRNLSMLDAMGPSLMALGAVHVGYSVRPEHYEVARVCLVGAIRHHSGAHWSAELERDWFEAILSVMEPMLRGAEAVTSNDPSGAGSPREAINPGER
jgi:hemoglobin-like flavoprotein